MAKHVIGFIALSILSMLSLVVPQHTNDLENDPKFDVRVSELISRNTLQFAQEICATLLEDSTSKSEVFSPLSIFGALSLLLLGSSGQSYEELINLLKFSDDSYLSQNPWKIHEEFGLMIEDIAKDFPNPQHKRPLDFWQIHRTPISAFINHRHTTRDPRSFQNISVANGIFIQKGFSIRLDYKDAIESAYKSSMHSLDFTNNAPQSTAYINNWVNEKTEGKIKDLFQDSVSPATKVIIASALYFKALWERTFMEGATKPQNFYPNGISKDPITVDMMAHGGAFPFYDAKEYDCRILGLPYRRNLTTMFVIIPNNSNRQRLRQLQSELTADKITEMISKMEWKTAIILMPKMHITNRLNLKTVLQKMGIRTLFENGQSDLSLISSGAEVSPGLLTGLLSTVFSPNVLQNNKYPGYDDPADDRFLFSRVGENDITNKSTLTIAKDETIRTIITNTSSNTTSTTAAAIQQTKRNKRSAVTYKASSEFRQALPPLRLKDLVVGKRITKSYPRKKTVSRGRRQITTAILPDPSISLKRLDSLRVWGKSNQLTNPGLYTDEIMHKIDLTINESGTEGAAVTVTTLYRSGTDVVFRVDTPFMFLIRHDDTKLPLFYGTVYEPTNF